MSRRTERIFKLEKEIRELSRRGCHADMADRFLILKEIESKKSELEELKKGTPK